VLTPVTEITLAPHQRIADFLANILGAVLTKIISPTRRRISEKKATVLSRF